MNVVTNKILVFAGSLALAAAPCLCAQDESASAALQSVAVNHGTASFTAPTSISAIEISGQSHALQARVQIRPEATGLTLERIEAWLPVNTLATGMALRDEHMRQRIFTTAQGETPDLRFASGPASCPGVAPGREATCTLTGTLTLRGVAHRFSLPLKLRPDRAGAVFRAQAEGVVKLSDYGIEQPTQLGVKISNEVRIRLEFSGQVSPAAAPVTTALGRTQ